ncbi:transcription factor HBP-1b(c38)-like isoform X2 [Salvia miltiorrhiza]|uniref:transcription factor HBP-1b(c38)-like isoform X2 n=1 Tax=Salvia miltiorrhiza TaxID=226208 RepID=UPI0025ABF074|nr:transcription factor HBP-1b(c38)-like isoform X2 [Salvia miltiorrhiza]
MARATVNIGGDANRRASSGMPSFISQAPLSNTIGKEANAAQTSVRPDLGGLEQYIGFRVGDASNASHVFNPVLNSQTMSPDPRNQSGAFDMSSASTNANFSRDFRSGAGQVQKGLQQNLVSATGAQDENWRESNMADSSSHTETSTDMDPDDKNYKFEIGQSTAVGASDSGDRSKTLRRLAQNREAARKSRLRKKAYVQQLENSRLKLTQLEQEVQQARQQGVIVSSNGDQSNAGTGNGALAFDMEYTRWVEEQNRRINELRAAVNSHVSDAELVTIVENTATHFNEIFTLKGNAAKAEVFHILSGMWKTPAERCFLWIGGFRPSELLKILVSQLEPLTEQQLTGICNLQQSSNQAEDALSQGMEALQQSLAETLASGSSANVANYMGQMAMAMGKLGTLEGFLQQADNLRQQTLQQMHRTLTTRQSARALLLIHDYFSRLRALSSLWLARPKEG